MKKVRNVKKKEEEEEGGQCDSENPHVGGCWAGLNPEPRNVGNI